MQSAMLGAAAMNGPHGAQALVLNADCQLFSDMSCSLASNATEDHVFREWPCFTNQDNCFQSCEPFDLTANPGDSIPNPFLKDWLQPELFYDCLEDVFEECIEPDVNSSYSGSEGPVTTTDVLGAAMNELNCCSSCIFAFDDGNHSTSQHPDTFVGTESYYNRAERYDVFSASSRLRFGLLVDTGAPDNVVGEEWVNRISKEHNLAHEIRWKKHSAELSGVGHGSVKANWRAKIPISLSDNHSACWDAQVVSGAGQYLPPLHGLESLIRHRTVLDFTDPKNLTMSCLVKPNTRQTFKLEKINGHLILPCDHYQNGKRKLPVPSKEAFIKDPLGLNTWFTYDQNDSETPRDTTYNDETTCQATYDTTYNDNLTLWTWPQDDDDLEEEEQPTTTPTTFSESLQLSGPDDPSKKEVAISAAACPAGSFSENNTTQQHAFPTQQTQSHITNTYTVNELCLLYTSDAADE